MEIVTISDRKFEINPLTRGQIKKLKEFGFTYFNCTPSLEQAHESLDAVFDMVLTEDEIQFIDARPNRDAIKIWKAVLAETYGGGSDEGNSNGTSDGSTTETESSTVTAAVPEKTSQ